MLRPVLLSKILWAANKYSLTFRGCSAQRSLTLSSVIQGKRSRDPYDKRWGIHPKDASKNGGTRDIAKKLGVGIGMPQQPGYNDKKGVFHLVPEMIPEFVVPNLKDFKLKAYVSYRIPDIKQSEFTAQNLFDATYAKDIVNDFKVGKLDSRALEERIEKLKLKAN